MSGITVTVPLEKYNALVDAAQDSNKRRRELAQSVVDALSADDKSGRTSLQSRVNYLLVPLQQIAVGASDIDIEPVHGQG